MCIVFEGGGIFQEIYTPNFEQTKFSLEAAQQTFTQVQGLTLFNYI